MRDRLPELAPVRKDEARIARLLLRLQAEPEGIGVGADAQFDHRDLAILFGAAHRDVVVGSKLAVRQIGRARLKAKQFSVLVGHDLEHQPVEVRKRVSIRRFAPVARIPIEDQALSRLILAKDEWTGPDDLARSSRRSPGLCEGSG